MGNPQRNYLYIKFHVKYKQMECNICKQVKNLDNFYLNVKLNRRDKKCNYCKAEYKQKKQKENPERFKKATKKWYDSKGKNWRKNYEIENRKYINDRDRKKYHEDPLYRNKKILRTRLSTTTSGKKIYNKILSRLGIAHKLYLDWIEFQFAPDMTWENQGSFWTIDHVIPIDYFIKNSHKDEEKLTDEEMNHWSNLRPQIGSENFRKSNKLDLILIKEHYSVTVSLFIGLAELEIDNIVQRLQRKWVIEE